MSLCSFQQFLSATHLEEPLRLLQATLVNSNVQTPAEAGQWLVKSELSQGELGAYQEHKVFPAQLLFSLHWHMQLFLHRGKPFWITSVPHQFSSLAS